MKKIVLSQLEKMKIFLNEYYFGYGILFSIIRIIGGPLILVFGLDYYLNNIDKTLVAYSGFMILFGIYYIVKPFIIILTRKTWFNNFDLDYDIQSEKIIIKSKKSESILDYSDVKHVKKRKTYYKLTTLSKQGIYLPIQFLEPSEVAILNELKNK